MVMMSMLALTRSTRVANTPLLRMLPSPITPKYQPRCSPQAREDQVADEPTSTRTKEGIAVLVACGSLPSFTVASVPIAIAPVIPVSRIVAVVAV